MLKKLLASVGIGSASVDLVVSNSQVEVGGVLEGNLNLRGGNIEQDIEQVYINLVLKSTYGSGDETKHIHKNIASIKVMDKFTLKPGQEETISVNFKIPNNIPISRGRTKYHLQTGLDIEQAIDPKDYDNITVMPNRCMKMLFEAIHTLGFSEKHNSGDFNGRYQEFEYKPTRFMANELDEIEIYPTAGEQSLQVVMQIDKRNRGLFGGLLDNLDLDEKYIRFDLPYDKYNSTDEVVSFLRNTIEREYRKML